MAALRAAVTADGGWNTGASLGPHSSRSAHTASPHSQPTFPMSEAEGKAEPQPKPALWICDTPQKQG